MSICTSWDHETGCMKCRQKKACADAGIAPLDYSPHLGSPRRIQRRRIKGWRMPENTVNVCRPGKWGNPHKVGAMVDGKPLSACGAVGRFHADLVTGVLGYTAKDVIRELRGKNLACFCGLDKPCHADVLIRVANTGREAR